MSIISASDKIRHVYMMYVVDAVDLMYGVLIRVTVTVGVERLDLGFTRSYNLLFIKY